MTFGDSELAPSCCCDSPRPSIRGREPVGALPVVEVGLANPRIVAKLIVLRDSTDPFALAKVITEKLARIYEVARHKTTRTG